MGSLLAGIVVFAITAIAFWFMLPHGGKYHRYVGTEWEPYIGVAFTSAVALSMTLALSGVLDLVGTP
jgi:hypothetical protein